MYFVINGDTESVSVNRIPSNKFVFILNAKSQSQRNNQIENYRPSASLTIIIICLFSINSGQ